MHVKHGTIKEVTSLTNPLIKELKALTMKKRRKREGLFLVEGLKLIIEGLEQKWPIETLLVAKNHMEHPLCVKIISESMALGAQILLVSEKILSAITRRENTQKAIGVFAKSFLEGGKIRPKKNALYLGLDRVRDPGNLGTIIRTADAVGVESIFLIGDCTDPYSLETVRASMGSIFAVPLCAMTEEAFLAWQKEHKIRTIGTHLKGAKDYRRIQYKSA